MKAICTSSLGEVFVSLDKDGRELGRSIMYTDKRGEKECAEIVERFGVMPIMRITGTPPHPMYTLGKLLWMQRHDRETFDKIHTIHYYGDYILYKLGGVHAMDYSLASRSMAFDVVNKRWDETLLGAAGVSPSIYPQPQAAGAIIGRILPGVAADLGLGPDVTLVLGAHDQIMCAVGAGVTKSGEAANGIGTVDCITPVFDKPMLTQKMVDRAYICMPYIFENTYVTYAFTMSGGALLKWFRDNFARLDKLQADAQGLDIYAELEKGMPTEPTSLLVLPHFAGSPIPDPDIHAKGAILNLSLDTKREEIYRAFMEGETFEMKRNILALQDNGIEVKRLMTAGGGSRSEAFMQIRADILQREVATMAYEEAGTLGTAILAGAATGVFSSVAEACGRLAKVKRVFEPDPKNSAIYEAQFEKYEKLYALLKQVR